MKRFFALLWVPCFVGGCMECELYTGLWKCKMTVTSQTGCEGVANEIEWDYAMSESDDLECTTTSMDSGRMYDSANRIYSWQSGTLTAEDSDHMTGHLTNRISENADGSDSCVFSGPVDCKY